MLPTEEQQRGLCKMLYHALLELRNLGWEGKASQAADLADAFHNLPVYMHSQDFDWDIFRHFLKVYQSKYRRTPDSGVDYTALLEEIINGKFSG